MRLRSASMALVVLIAPSLAGTQSAGVDEVEACVRGNVPDSAIVQTIVLRSKDRLGAVTQSRATVYRRPFEEHRSRVLLRFREPPDMRGAGVLIIETEDDPEMFLYMPELRRVRRITKHTVSGSLFGTDFTYEEFERLQGIVNDADRVRLPDAVASDRSVYVVEARPGGEKRSAHERVVSYVDQDRCVPVKVEFFEKGDRLRKRLTADPAAITREGETFVPRRYLMEDVRDGTETELIVEEIEVGARIPKSKLSLTALQMGSD
jgi:hypothetical protein